VGPDGRADSTPANAPGRTLRHKHVRDRCERPVVATSERPKLQRRWRGSFPGLRVGLDAERDVESNRRVDGNHGVLGGLDFNAVTLNWNVAATHGSDPDIQRRPDSDVGDKDAQRSPALTPDRNR